MAESRVRRRSISPREGYRGWFSALPNALLGRLRTVGRVLLGVMVGVGATGDVMSDGATIG